VDWNLTHSQIRDDDGDSSLLTGCAANGLDLQCTVTVVKGMCPYSWIGHPFPIFVCAVTKKIHFQKQNKKHQ
jgi:hypothetical protein